MKQVREAAALLLSESISLKVNALKGMIVSLKLISDQKVLFLEMMTFKTTFYQSKSNCQRTA